MLIILVYASADVVLMTTATAIVYNFTIDAVTIGGLMAFDQTVYST